MTLHTYIHTYIHMHACIHTYMHYVLHRRCVSFELFCIDRYRRLSPEGIKGKAKRDDRHVHCMHRVYASAPHARSCVYSTDGSKWRENKHLPSTETEQVLYNADAHADAHPPKIEIAFSVDFAVCPAIAHIPLCHVAIPTESTSQSVIPTLSS